MSDNEVMNATKIEGDELVHCDSKATKVEEDEGNNF